jgi:hypothetical protein
MSIRLLQAVFLSGVYTAVDGATLTLAQSLEEDLVGQGKAVWVTAPAQRTDLVDHATHHKQLGIPMWLSGIPFVRPPGDGSANGLQFTGAIGAFTLSAAVVATALYHSYVYMPAGFGGSAYPAGWYYALWSSGTAGTLYMDTYDPTSGVPPTVPVSPTPFPGNLTGWTTAPTTEIQACQFTLPGGFLGKNGLAEFIYRLWCNNSAGNKQVKIKFGSTVMHYMAPTTTAYNNDILAFTQNEGAENRQVNTRNGLSVGTGTTSVDGDIRTIDTSVDVVVSMTMQIPANTDGLVAAFRMCRITKGV